MRHAVLLPEQVLVLVKVKRQSFALLIDLPIDTCIMLQRNSVLSFGLSCCQSTFKVSTEGK
jgi:hypothetical protein